MAFGVGAPAWWPWPKKALTCDPYDVTHKENKIQNFPIFQI